MISFHCNVLSDGRYVAFASGLLGTVQSAPRETPEAAAQSANEAYGELEALKASVCTKLGLPLAAEVSEILSAVAALDIKKGKK